MSWLVETNSFCTITSFLVPILDIALNNNKRTKVIVIYGNKDRHDIIYLHYYEIIYLQVTSIFGLWPFLILLEYDEDVIWQLDI